MALIYFHASLSPVVTPMSLFYNVVLSRVLMYHVWLQATIDELRAALMTHDGAETEWNVAVAAVEGKYRDAEHQLYEACQRVHTCCHWLI